MAAEHQKVLVLVFFREQGKPAFLLLRTSSERGGFWQPVTGSVEGGERIADAALREMREETGLQAQAIRPVSKPYGFQGRQGQAVMEYPFLAEVAPAGREKVRMDPREHQQYLWVDAEQALKLLKYESNARVLQDALNELSVEGNK